MISSMPRSRLITLLFFGFVLFASCLFAGIKMWRHWHSTELPASKRQVASEKFDSSNVTAGGKNNRTSSSGLSAEINHEVAERIRRKREQIAEGRYDKPAEAMEFFRLKRLPAGEQEIPVEKYQEAYRQMERMQQYSFADGKFQSSRKLMGKSAAVLPAWTQLGPGNIGGRTRVIIIAPNTPDTMYAAGVAGGVWKTTNGGASWTPVSDLIANLAVNSMAMDPANPNILYAGTGEGYSNGGAVRGAGIFKTTDGGANWSRINSTNTTDFHYVNDLVVSPNNSNRIYAATRTGVWRTTDGGNTWTKVLNATSVGSTTVAINGGCLDLAIRTDRPTDYIFASCGNQEQARIFRNTDASGSGQWLQVHTEIGAGRTSLAIAPSNQNTIYALSAALAGPFDDALHAVFRSTSSGDSGSWEARVRNTDPNKLNASLLSIAVAAFGTNCGFDTSNLFTGQGWYDNVIAVDPVDPNRVWVGGIDLFRSDDGGANWGMGAHAYLEQNVPQYVHPDHHAIVFHPQYNGTTNQIMFVGNDGGIYRTANARGVVAMGANAACNAAATGVFWTSLNNGYGVTQFYHGLPYPSGQTYFGGTQDNGTLRGSDAAGVNAWNEILGGDGGYVAVDPTNPNVIYAATTGISVRKSINGGASFVRSTTGISDTGLFITPYVMDPSEPQRLWLGGRSYLWRTTNGAASWTRASAVTPGSGSVSAVTVSPTNANFLLAGMSDGYILRTDVGLTSGSSTTWPSVRPRTGYVSCLAFDPSNKDIAYATYSTFDGVHVWKTTNGGVSWTGIDGTGDGALPNVPVHSIIVDPSNTARLYIGTDVGVFATTDGGTNWMVENTGFANVIIEALALNVVNGVSQLFAFTHGRGAWRVTANQSGCNYALAPSSQNFDAAGGNGTINVTAEPNGCNWTATSNAAWITINSGASGTTNGTINFSVAAHTGTATRTGTISAAGKTFTVTQSACTSISPSFQFFEAAGGNGTINIAGTQGCAWTVTGNPNWITINSGGSGSGNGATAFTVAANTGAASRQAVLTVAGQSFTVIQGGKDGSCAIMPIAAGQIVNGTLAQNDCSSLLRGEFYYSDRYSFSGMAGQRVAIRADSSAVDTYLYLLDPTGNVIATNDDGDNRTSARIPSGDGFFTLPVGGVYQIEVTSFSSSSFGAYSLSLSNGSADCNYSVAPGDQSFAASGGNGTVNVTTGNGCAWTATSNANWLMITSGSSGTGNGTVNFNLTANNGTARTAYLIVAGQIVTVIQAGNGALAAGRWATQSSGTTNQLNHVFFLDNNQGWTVGANSTSRATSNGGTAWNSFSVGGTSQNLTSVRFFDINNGWIGGVRLAAITSNGGSTWPRVEFTTGNRNRMFPVNSFNAFTVGDRDGGGLHTNLLLLVALGFASETPTLATLNTLRDVYFVDADNGLSVGDKGQIYRITKASSGGQFYEPQSNTTQNLNGIFMLDLCTGWVVGDGGVILKTLNGGLSWQQQSSSTTANLRDVHFANADQGWAVGDGGVIVVTSNGGANWATETSGVTADLKSVHTNSVNAVYAVGANGTIVKRTLCSYMLSATTAAIAFGGGNGSVNVTTTAGCAWMATSNANWLMITSGSSGSGNGTVNYSVAPNTGAERVGTLTIAGQTFTVTQAVACATATGIAPTSGFVGTQVTINGTNLTDVSAVKFANNVSAQFTVNSATSITATVPPGAATGPITISKIGCADVTTPAFTVTPAPTITLAPPTQLIGVGQSAMFTATINPALPAAVNLTLNSSNSIAATVPASLPLPAGQTSAQFNAPGLAAGMTTITASLPALYGGANAMANLTVVAGFEADVHPRPNGDVNGQVTTADWVQVGRFVGGLDQVNPGGEFQRADCAPRETLGNGALTVSDWVQAGRYSAGLDPITPVGGPTAPTGQFADDDSQSSLRNGRRSTVRATQLTAEMNSLTGKANRRLTVSLDAEGTESAVGFSLLFHPARWRFVSAELTAETSGATLIVNSEKAARGRIGIALALPNGRAIAAGEQSIVTLNFEPLSNADEALIFNFSDSPVAREIADSHANRLQADFIADFADAGIAACANVSAASFKGDALAVEQIVAAFGAELSLTNSIAMTLPLSKTLNGTRVVVTDSAGIAHEAGIFFVSARQVNYLLPDGLVEGVAMVAITNAVGKVSIGLIEIVKVEPSLFAANSDGQGVAAAMLLRVRSDGSQTYEAISQFDALQNRFVARPIEFGDQNEQDFLILYGTGFRHQDQRAAIKAVIGGIELPVSFAGAVEGFAGLDQINLPLPRGLAGRGDVEISVVTDGRISNAVKIGFR